MIPAYPLDGSNEKEFVNRITGFLGEVEEEFDSVWMPDHFMPKKMFMPDVESRNLVARAPTLEGFTTISYLSGLFRRFTFGNMVLCNSYRTPGLLAKMAATLQTLTGGRFILGIGAGCEEDEYVAYGYKFPPPKVRIEQLEEGVQIIRKMWTEDVGTFKGKYYRIDEAYCYPKPNPIPPILIGSGKGEKLILRVVARHADWWNLVNVSPKNFQHKLEILKEHCIKENRNYEEIVKTLANTVAIAKTEEEAWKIVSASPFKGNKENNIIGSPDAVVERISEYIELGINHFILGFMGSDRQMIDEAKLFAKEVIPTLGS